MTGCISYDIRTVLAALLLCLCLSAPAREVEQKRVMGVMEAYPAGDISVARRVERIGEYAAEGVTRYLYGPSDDEIRSSKGWKFQYPDKERGTLRQLMDACAAAGVEFVWTVEPGDAYNWDEADYKMLLNKLVLMYFTGVRSFAVLMEGPGYDGLMRRLETDFVLTRREKVTLYPKDFFQWADADVRAVPGESLDICPPVFPDTVTDAPVCRIGCANALSRIAARCALSWMSSVADYDGMAAWRQAVESVLPEIAGPYVLFAAYADETGMLADCRAETFGLEGYDAEKADALMEVFRALENMPRALSGCRDNLLEKAGPWVENMRMSGTRGINTLTCLKHYMDGDQVSFLKSYVDMALTAEQRTALAAHPVGMASLHPFCDAISEELAAVFYRMMGGGKMLASVSPSDASAPALDGNLSTFAVCRDRMVFDVPSRASRCHLLLGASEGMVIFRQLAGDGSLVAEKIVREPYIEMEVKPGVVKVDILGKVDVYETIFVSL